jgi:hypothetical protein
VDQDLPYQGPVPHPRLRPLLGSPHPKAGDRTRRRVVTARCDGCSAYVVNRRAMAKFSSGGHYNTYSGRCGACAGEGARETVGVATRSDYEGEERP